jgi:selenocysteine-specific elongation factor
VLLAEVALLDGVDRVLGARTRVRFHLGTSDVGARVVCAGGALRPGERREARIVLDEPVVARAGDRFVLRSASPLETIGGGVVGDPSPERRRPRPRAARAAAAADRLRFMLAEAGAHGVALDQLSVRAGVPPDAVPALVRGLGADVSRVGGRLYAASTIDQLRGQVEGTVARYHDEHPLDPGVPLQLVRVRTGAEGGIADDVIQRLVADGALELDGALVRRSGWSPRLTAAQERTRGELLATLERAGKEPPSVAELAAIHGSSTLDLLRLLEREGAIVQVESDRYYLRSVAEALAGALRAGMAPGREYPPPELREILGLSRKYLIPFLEYCDRAGVTQRRAAGRVVRPL